MGSGGQADAAAFAFGDDFLDGPDQAAGEYGVGGFAELLEFGNGPGFGSSGCFDSHGFSRVNSYSSGTWW